MTNIGELIPRQHLKVYRRVYEKIGALNLLGLADDGWRKPFSGIDYNLRILVKRGYLNEKDIPEINLHIHQCVAKRGPSFLLLTIPDALSLRHKGPTRRNPALNFLIYALSYDCRAFTGKPHYSAIADYLNQAEIYSNEKNHEPFDSDTLRKRAKRLDESDVSDTLLFGWFLCDSDDPLIPPEMAAGYDSRGYLKSLPHNPFDLPPKNNPLSRRAPP